MASLNVDITALSTREALLVSGRRAFAQRGYVGSSLTSIAQDAGLTTGAFYRHFGSKAEFSTVVFDAYRDDLTGALRRSRSLRAQIESWLLVAREHRGAVRIAQELMLVDPAEDASNRDLREATRSLLAGRLGDGITGSERELVARMIVDIITQYVFMESAGWLPERDARAVAVELERMVKRGLYRR
jgi:AcrR family transcriptional regulator